MDSQNSKQQELTIRVPLQVKVRLKKPTDITQLDLKRVSALFQSSIIQNLAEGQITKEDAPEWAESAIADIEAVEGIEILHLSLKGA